MMRYGGRVGRRVPAYMQDAYYEEAGRVWAVTNTCLFVRGPPSPMARTFAALYALRIAPMCDAPSTVIRFVSRI